jgi:hypothetical protein
VQRVDVGDAQVTGGVLGDAAIIAGAEVQLGAVAA